MTTPLVSVLMTVYNRERYLAAAVESVLAQSMCDYELIIVDDSSEDGSVEIAKSWAAQDSRIRFFRNDHTLGDYPNRMQAAAKARGRFLKYVDSDDLIYPRSLEIMVDAMQAYPDAALGVSHSNGDDAGPYPKMLTPHQAWLEQFLGRGCLNSGPTGAIIRLDAFKGAGGFRNWGVLSDMDLWCRLSASWPILLLQPGLVFWRRHDGQEYTRNNAAHVYLKRGFELYLNLLSSSECPLSASERQAALERARQHHARRLLSLGFRQRRPLAAWRLFNASGLSMVELLSGMQKYRNV